MAQAPRFRHDLAQALPLWLSDELVTPDQAERLRRYYRLDELGAHDRGRFASAVLLFGAVLVGLGILTFIAANWGSIPPAARALGGLALMVAVDAIGFRRWNRPALRRRGHALLGLGTLLLGGNMVLMAQWFQLSGSNVGLLVAWAVGALAMGWALGHGFSVGVAAVLMLSALFAGASWPWLFPWLFLLVFVPLGSRLGSWFVWLCGAVGVGISVQFLIYPLGPATMTVGAIAWALGLWATSERGLAEGPRRWLAAYAGRGETPALEVLVGLWIDGRRY